MKVLTIMINCKKLILIEKNTHIYEGRFRSNRTFAITIVHIWIIKNNIYEMKAVSFIVKSAEFQTNRLMDIKSAQLLVRLVPGGRGTL